MAVIGYCCILYVPLFGGMRSRDREDEQIRNLIEPARPPGLSPRRFKEDKEDREDLRALGPGSRVLKFCCICCVSIRRLQMPRARREASPEVRKQDAMPLLSLNL